MERKITTPFVVAGLAVAFAAASAWVWFSRGKNARAVRTKFKIGGLLLTLTTAVTTQSCNSFRTCYDPGEVLTPHCSINDRDLKFANGDTLRTIIYDNDYTIFSFEIVDKDNNSLQKDIVGPTTAHKTYNTISVGSYVGEAKINIYGEKNVEQIEQDKLINSFDITIEAVATLPEDKNETDESTDNVE